MELALGIIIGLLISLVVLLIEVHLSRNEKSITSLITKKPSNKQGYIIEEEVSDDDINKLLHE